MSELIIAISLWCQGYGLGKIECNKSLFQCVSKDLKEGDKENKKYLEQKLWKCLEAMK